MRARLIAETGECTPPAIDLLPGTPATLGRSRDNTIYLRDDLCSRLHVKIYFDNDAWFVRDFGLNGTRINGQLIKGSASIDNGSVLQIGSTRLRFECIRSTVIKSGNGSSDSKREFPPQLPGFTINRALITPPPVQPLSQSQAKNQAQLHDGTKIMNSIERDLPTAPQNENQITSLKLDELTSLCRYMEELVSANNTQDAVQCALDAILRQTTARVAGYLSLEPSDPTPKMIRPEKATVDVTLSRKLTERVRHSGKMVWLFAESGNNHRPTESLNAYADAVCLPIGGQNGVPFASLHVYRTGLCFSDRDVYFIEAVGAHLAKTVELHRHRRALEAENVRLRNSAGVADELVGDSTAMSQLRLQISKAAPLAINVLIQGESGSGKELVAQALHRSSPRNAGPFVVVNCAAIAPTLMEAELFGYKKGAFSGADRDHPGLFSQADEGTLFLDEVAELSLECQAKLLRVIEGKPFRPVGGTTEIKVDVRVIAATHRDLDREVQNGRFRQDLLFRLKVIPLRVPPLREHREDIPELAQFFIERIGVQCRRNYKLTAPALEKIVNYSWPGNVRQLRAVLENTAVMSDHETIDIDQLTSITTTDFDPSKAEIPDTLDIDELETWAIRKALVRTGGNVSQSARLLGMSRDTLHTKIKKKGIERLGEE